jgi:hypothetical protein
MEEKKKKKAEGGLAGGDGERRGQNEMSPSMLTVGMLT